VCISGIAAAQAFSHTNYGVFQKNGPSYLFCNNFGKCTPILILFSLLQQENFVGAQNLSYFYHLTFIMLPLYLAKTNNDAGINATFY